MAFLSFRRSKPEPRGFCVPTLFFCASDCVVCNITEMCFHLSAAVSCPWITSSAQKDESRPTFHRENTVIRNRHTQSLGERTGTSLCCDSYFPELLSPGIFLLLMFLSNIKKRKKHVLNSQNGDREGAWLDVINLAAAVVMMSSACDWNIRGTLEDEEEWETKVKLTGAGKCLVCTEEHNDQLC